jgi:hypothetical protein
VSTTAPQWVAISGAYLLALSVHLEHRWHIENETTAALERIAELEAIIRPGILPHAQEVVNQIHLHLADLAQRVSLVELDLAKIDAALERVKPLFTPRKKN